MQTLDIPQLAVPVTFASAQIAGNLNVVVVGWNDTTAAVSSVTDSVGNVYTLAVGPTKPILVHHAVDLLCQEHCWSWRRVPTR